MLAVLLSPFILVWGFLPGLVVFAWFLAAVTSFAPVLLALLAEKCKVSRPMALAAGTALGISALYADWSLRAFPDALGLVMVLGVLLLWLRDSRRWIHGAGLGLLLGLAIANKPILHMARALVASHRPCHQQTPLCGVDGRYAGDCGHRLRVDLGPARRRILLGASLQWTERRRSRSASV